MKVLPYVACALLMSISTAASADIWRCAKGSEVRFEQKKVSGYDCKSVAHTTKGRFSVHVPAPSPVSSVATLPPLPPGKDAAPSSPEALPVALPSSSSSSWQASATPVITRGTIYKRVVNGVVEFSTKASPGAKVASHYIETCYACGAKPSVDFGRIALKRSAYDDAIVVAAQQNAIDPAWVRAIIHAESNFNPQAVSRTGAQGLMQLMPATARRFGVNAPFDPRQNIAGGTRYLAWLLKRFNGNHMLATAAYNAGEGAVDRYRGIPPYSETRNYVQRVGTLRTRYTAL